MEVVSNEVLEEAGHALSLDLAGVVDVVVLPSSFEFIADDGLGILRIDVYVVLENLSRCFLSTVPLEPEFTIWLALSLATFHSVLRNDFTHEVIAGLALVSFWKFSVGAWWEAGLSNLPSNLKFVIANVEGVGMWWNVFPVVL